MKTTVSLKYFVNDCRWLRRAKQELADVKKNENIKITIKSIQKCVSDMSNWKAPGPDGLQGFWFKRMKNLHDRLAKHKLV